MVLDPRLTRAGRLAIGACLITAAYSQDARSADTPARVVLLAAGQRASVVVEFADEVPKATAIEAPDSRSFAVEIGPVHSAIANQLLQAASASPLVAEVRVRSVPQGPQGALITLSVTAKTAVSGLVRRAQRRIYIDLEPLTPGTAAMQRGPAPASPEAAALTAVPARATPDTTVPPAASPGSSAATNTTPAPPIATVPATSTTAPASLPADEIGRRAEVLARQLDVKGLEKLKADLIAARPPSATKASSASEDPAIAQIDSLLDEARKNRLLTDAKLFKGPPPADAAAPPTSVTPASSPTVPNEAFHRAIVPLAAELKTMNAMLSQWQPGFVPAPNLPQSLEALSIRLRALHPPAALSASHEQLCVALSALAKSWIPGPDGVSLIPVGDDARLIVRAKAALYDYLQGIALEQSTAADRSSNGLS